MMIGLSLSSCVLDLAMGRVNMDQVGRIIAGTEIRSVRDLNGFLAKMKEREWSKYPEAERIFFALLTAGKIFQPRVQKPLGASFQLPDISGERPIWVSTEDEIQWQSFEGVNQEVPA